MDGAALDTWIWSARVRRRWNTPDLLWPYMQKPGYQRANALFTFVVARSVNAFDEDWPRQGVI